MSHSDIVKEIPQGFVKIATTPSAPFAAIAHHKKPLFGIQFHPEVTHSPRGKEIFDRFTAICGVKRDWKMSTFIDKEIKRIRTICGDKGRVIGAVSGGVDSTVAAKLMHEAIGDRFHAIMVDNGVLRADEGKQVHKMLNEDLGVNLTVVDASDLFLERLKGVEDPEQKRKIIGNTFINVFEEEAAKIEAEAERDLEDKKAKGQAGEAKGKIEWLLQGTLYPDVIESISFKGPSATIKTHHNVGGLLKDMKLKLIEPLRELFKGEHPLSQVCQSRARLTLPAARRTRRGPCTRTVARYPSPPRWPASLPRTRTRNPHSWTRQPRAGCHPAESRQDLHRGDSKGGAVRPDCASFLCLAAGQSCRRHGRCADIPAGAFSLRLLPYCCLSLT